MLLIFDTQFFKNMCNFFLTNIGTIKITQKLMCTQTLEFRPTYRSFLVQDTIIILYVDSFLVQDTIIIC